MTDDPGNAPAPEPTRLLRRMEEGVLELWKRQGVPARALQLNPEGPVFRFTEGPPTANGLPHLGSAMTRALKDAFLRYRRMTGFRIAFPLAGWDCHGLPVEVEVEKSHHWTNKKQITEYGVAAFVEECRQSVMTYEAAWRRFSERVGYWLDFDHAYFTMAPSYVESVWWSLRELHDQGLLTKGHYVVPYCARCETSLALHEVAQGYRETSDPSVTLRLRLEETLSPGTESYLLVWTTTPWTLPANLAVAVGEDLPYVAFRGEGGAVYVLAEAALPRYFPEEDRRPEVVLRLRGKDLVGRRYRPPFPGLVPESEARHKVYAADFVTLEDGTGLVHTAPSFGADDYALGKRVGLGVFDPLDSSGRFTAVLPLVEGRTFKEADARILADLADRGLLYRSERIVHAYPHCWRCDRPLMYRALDSWFVGTHEITERLLRHNATVDWIPAHVRDGRFGNFLKEGRDWAISRSRYWGTPLPIWNCPRGHVEVVGSFAQLKTLTRGPFPDPFDPHRPYLDELTLSCPTHGETLVREPYVIDVWYDSGSAPFAQIHWPFGTGPPEEPPVPLDFVSEGVDQTRGWFYTLHVLAGALFDRPAYRHAIVNEFALDAQGRKMSKSRGNAEDPMALVERMGADALRMGIYLSSYTEAVRYTEQAFRQSGVRMLTTLWNVVEFYRTNQALDRLPAVEAPPRVSRALDRWLLSRLSDSHRSVREALDRYDAHGAAETLRGLVDDLSTWWLRRSRARFWAEGVDPGKEEAYAALSFALRELSLLLAPLAPFTAEHLWQTLYGTGPAPARSVHLTALGPPPPGSDPDLERAMAESRELVELGRALRMKAGVKARIPLAEFVVAGGPGGEAARVLGNDGDELLEGELNVKRVTWLPPGEGLSDRFPEADWVTRSGPGPAFLALSRRPSRELWLEGLAREVVRRVQALRKERRLRFDQRIGLEIWAGGDVLEALRRWEAWIAEQAQASPLRLHDVAEPDRPSDLHHFPDPEFWVELTPGA